MPIALSAMNRFNNALQPCIDDDSPSEIGFLAGRLSPYRIGLRPASLDAHTIHRPVLTLENEQEQPCSLPDNFITTYQTYLNPGFAASSSFSYHSYYPEDVSEGSILSEPGATLDAMRIGQETACVGYDRMSVADDGIGSSAHLGYRSMSPGNYTDEFYLPDSQYRFVSDPTDRSWVNNRNPSLLGHSPLKNEPGYSIDVNCVAPFETPVVPSTTLSDDSFSLSSQQDVGERLETRQLPTTCLRKASYRGKLLLDEAMTIVIRAADNCIREDYVEFLENNLPRWKAEGLWYQTPLSVPTSGHMGFEALESVYSCVCQLDMWMEDDPIRKRVSLVLLYSQYEKTYREWRTHKNYRPKAPRGVGKGEATSTIDTILSTIHPEWNTSDARTRSALRSKFHDRKRFGKRWSTLVGVLGPGILFLCSSELAGIVRNTRITMETLEGIAHAVATHRSDVVHMLSAINPIAESLFCNEQYAQYDVNQLLQSLCHHPPSPLAGSR